MHRADPGRLLKDQGVPRRKGKKWAGTGGGGSRPLSPLPPSSEAETAAVAGNEPSLESFPQSHPLPGDPEFIPRPSVGHSADGMAPVTGKSGAMP